MRKRLGEVAGKLEGLGARDFEAWAETGETAKWLAELALELGGLSDLLTQVYFSHVVPRVS